jgi:hypothetical protein
MNPGFVEIVAATDAEQRDLFVTTATRLGTTVQNIEKDFWVCWTLDALFNGLEAGGPRLLFKGGTSLSKSYKIITRFSEDIDITVFRSDLGQPASMEDLAEMSGKKRNARLDAIKAACQTYVHGPLLARLRALAAQAMESAGKSASSIRIEIDAVDPDGQSLLVWYPSVTADGAYITPAVKIEAGAKSALDPHTPVPVTPYIAGDLASTTDLSVANITTVDPARTFWDKIVILHGLRRWYDRRSELRGGGQRVSRHYYDVFRLLASRVGRLAIDDMDMAADCVAHAQMFFNRPHLDLETAAPGTYALTPHDAMIGDLRRDYAAMSTMIFGVVPGFEEVMESIKNLEFILNTRQPSTRIDLKRAGVSLDTVRQYQRWRGVDPSTGDQDAIATVYNVLGDQVELAFEASGARLTTSAETMLVGAGGWSFVSDV